MSRWLRAAGVGPGQRVAVALEPSSAYTAVVLGVIAAGAAIAPINTRLTQREVDEYLSVLDPAMILLSETVSIAKDSVSGAAMYVADTKGVGADIWIDRLVHRRAELCQATDSSWNTALVIGTGGTTGLPKAASFSGSALALWCLHAAFAQRLRSDDVELFASPFFHGTLVTSLLAVLTAGATVVITSHGNVSDTDVVHRGPTVTRDPGRTAIDQAACRRRSLRRCLAEVDTPCSVRNHRCVGRLSRRRRTVVSKCAAHHGVRSNRVRTRNAALWTRLCRRELRRRSSDPPRRNGDHG